MSYFVFYTDEDRVEIKSWIREYYSPIDQRIKDLELADFQKKLDALQKENTALKYELDALKRKPDSTVQLQSEISKLKYDIDELKRKPDSTAQLQAEILDLKSELDELKRKPDSTAQLQAEILNLKSEFQAEILALKSELAALKKVETPIQPARIEKILPPTPIQPPPKIEIATPKKIEVTPQEISPSTAEKIFYLKPNDEVFITSDRKNISAQICKALNVDDMKNFLLADNSEMSKKFQKLINVHFNAVKSFVDKLKLKDLDDEELSETVTSKYFKLFQQIIFDNLIVAVKRGLKTSDNFYLEFLTKINAYLEQCGIYTVNAKSGGKVTDEDYKNMSPQIIKTSEKNLAGIISEIERLPYRINYLDEFGEKNFFQYNGIMNIYKAV